MDATVTETKTRRPAPARLADIERALDRGDLDVASTGLASLELPPADELHELKRALRVATEIGHADLCWRLLERMAESPRGGLAARLIEAEHWIAVDRPERARRVLAASPPGGNGPGGNIVVPALRAVLARFAPAVDETALEGAPGAARAGEGNGGQSRPARIGSRRPPPLEIEPHILWFEPALTALLFYLEREVERLEPTRAVHEARTTLFRPDFRPETCPRPRRGLVARVTEPFRKPLARERARREYEVDMRLHLGDLPGALSLLREWLETDPDAFGGKPSFEDPRNSLVVSILHVLDRFDEVVEHIESLQIESLVESAPEAVPILAYARLARGELGAAESLLDAALTAHAGTADIAHLRGIAFLRRGQTARAVAWFRRASLWNDIDVVELVRKELKLPGVS